MRMMMPTRSTESRPSPSRSESASPRLSTRTSVSDSRNSPSLRMISWRSDIRAILSQQGAKAGISIALKAAQLHDGAVPILDHFLAHHPVSPVVPQIDLHAPGQPIVNAVGSFAEH